MSNRVHQSVRGIRLGPGTGNNAVNHGFTWQNGNFTTVDYPNASATTVNGVNDEGDIVGFYTDAAGNTDGFLGLP